MRSSDGADGLGRSSDDGNSGGAARPGIYSSIGTSTDCAQQLSYLLERLGTNSMTNEFSGRTDASIAHAAETIARWLTYLPAPCVRTMVEDGWHWST